MKFELKMALRFLRSGRGQTAFILLGIAIGVSVQIFLGTLITSLQEDLVRATVGNSPHIVVRSEAPETTLFRGQPGGETAIYTEGSFVRSERGLENWELLLRNLDGHRELTAVSPVVSGNAFLLRGGVRTPLVLRGIDGPRANGIYQFDTNMAEGSFLLEAGGILVGTDLADELQIRTGDGILLELPGGQQQILTVAGLFDLGSQNLNLGWAFLDLRRAQTLFGFEGTVSAVELQVRDVFAADRTAQALERSLIGVELTNWKEENASLLTALQSQSSSSYTIQFFVLLAITLGIASVLAVSVVQKQRQIGILKAMGTPSRITSRIFILQGGILGLIGAVLGLLAGFLLIQGFLYGTAVSTGTPLFPLQIRLLPSLAIVLITTVASVISAIVPARTSARLDPIDVMKG